MARLLWYEAHVEIATFALPLLKDYMIRKSGYPGPLLQEMNGDHTRAQQRWDDILLDIINALENIIDDDWDPSKEEAEKHQRSLQLFGKWFSHLWD